MNQKNSLIVLLTGLAITLSFCTSKKKQNKNQTRPNILFIMSDDHAYQAISAYNDHLIQTPHIDRLAKEGIKFTNACVTNSICAPSRATILTGKHTHINGKINNIVAFDTAQVTFPQLFQDAGYQTAMFGKLHFGNNPKGVDDFMILPGQGSYINPDFITNNGDTTIMGYVTDIITDLTLDWLEIKRDPKKPFMMMYLHKAPHRNWWPRADKFNEFTKKTFPQPATLYDEYENRGTAAQTAEMNILHHMKYSSDSKIRPETIEKMGKVIPEVPGNTTWGYKQFSRGTKEQQNQYTGVLDSISDYFETNWPTMTDKQKIEWKYQRYMQDYLACISSVDDNVGRVLDYLDESGLAENTLVVYTSDQGFYLGEHGWFDKRFIYDESFKTPLLVRWPNKITPGTTNEEMVQNLDFAQTLLEAAQINAPEDMQGESLLPLLTGKEELWDREAVYYHYYEYPSVHMVKRHYGIVTKEFKLAHFYYDVDEWELYDRKNDPQEMKNVYNDPQYSETVVKLTKELEGLRTKYKDSKELDQKFIELTINQSDNLN
jgi:arylsulfatase A-like enzyme